MFYVRVELSHYEREFTNRALRRVYGPRDRSVGRTDRSVGRTNRIT